MTYALNLADDGRIMSACLVLPHGNYKNIPIVETLPDGDITDYLYVDGEYIHDPLPKPEPPEPQPTHDERITALEATLAAYEAAYAEGVNEA